MPNSAVRILVSATLVASLFSGPAGADQQSRDNTKPTSQPAQPAPTPAHGNAAPNAGKFAPVSRDVCEKHPNLKQCSGP